MSRYPFSSYPRGWFKMAFSDELRAGTSKSVHYFGQDLICQRDISGKSCVKNEKDLSYWHSCENNGIIFAYYDPSGQPPTFDLPELSEYGAQGWTAYHKLQWRVRVHVQEIAENAVDYAHFVQLHTYQGMPRVESLEMREHNFRIVLHSHRRIHGVLMPTTSDISYHGLGLVISPTRAGSISIIAVLTLVPIDEEYIEINLCILHRKSKNPLMNLLFSLFTMRHIKVEFERDIPVWEHKLYYERPVLCRGDGPIVKLRKWAKQFFPQTASPN